MGLPGIKAYKLPAILTSSGAGGGREMSEFKFRLELSGGRTLIFQYPPDFFPRLEALLKEQGYRLVEGRAFRTDKIVKYYSTNRGDFRRLLGLDNYYYEDSIEAPLYRSREFNLAFFRIVPDHNNKIVIPLLEYIEYEEFEEITNLIAKALKRILMILNKKKIVIEMIAKEVEEDEEI